MFYWLNQTSTLEGILIKVKLYSILFEELLPEGRIEDFSSKLSGTAKELYDKVYTLQPKLSGKFAGWLSKIAPTAMVSAEDLHGLLTKFDSLAQQNKIQQKDIGKYASVDDVKSAVEAGEQTVSKTQERETAKSDSTRIYEDAKYLVVEPQSTSAACFYGSSTKWCISATEGENHFQRYHNEGARFAIIIDKKAVKTNPYAKVAVAYIPTNTINQGDPETLYSREYLKSSVEIYDSEDHLHTEADLIGKFPKEVLDAVNRHIGRLVLPASEEESDQIVAQKTPELFNEQLLGLYAAVSQAESPEQASALKERAKNLISRANLRQIGISFIRNFMFADEEGVGDEFRQLMFARLANLFHDPNAFMTFFGNEPYNRGMSEDVAAWAFNRDNPWGAKVLEVMARTVGRISSDTKAEMLKKRIGSDQSYWMDMMITYLNIEVRETLKTMIGPTIGKMLRMGVVSLGELKAAYRDAVQFTAEQGLPPESAEKYFSFMSTPSGRLLKQILPADELTKLFKGLQTGAFQVTGNGMITVDQTKMV